MNETKRQHYVPRTYLEKFGFKSGNEVYIKALPISNPQKEKIFELNIINACLERHLYTLPGSDEHERMLLEKFYAENIEAHYNRIYGILTDPAKIDINDEEREVIISTLVTMFYRTTKWINLHDEFMKITFSRMFDLCSQTGKDYFLYEGEKISIAGKTLDQFVKEYKLESKPTKVITQLEVAFKLIEARKANDGIFVMKLGDNCEFITSDNPVLIQSMSMGRALPFDPENIMKLPLDTKHIVMLMPNGGDAKNKIIRHTVTEPVCSNKALSVNVSQFRNAERFILGSDSSLNSFITIKEKSDRPLTAEDVKHLKTMEDVIKKAQEFLKGLQ